MLDQPQVPVAQRTNPERSFKEEVRALRLGDGEVFRGEGILAVTKAILQSGVAYVGGYQGAPVSHLVDVLVESQDLLDELGVHLETCTNEASAAAMLGASINYPMRGCVTWKSIVGTNVAADALSNLASPGVIGGALIVVGEDYGEGASVIQERTQAYALKSSVWLMDPRPSLPTIVRCTEKAFELSEATNTPVMMELRIRACHVTGEFVAKDNKAPTVSRNQRARQSGGAQLRPHLASALDLRAREGQGRGPPARGRALHRRAWPERVPSRASAPISASSSRAASPTCWCVASTGSRSKARCRRWCSTSRIRWCPTRSPISARASAPC